VWNADYSGKERTMNSHLKPVFLGGGLALLLAGTALSDEGVSVKITNDGTEDIVVTVYDVNAGPERKVLTNERINGFTSVPISVVADATGMANLRWTATSTDSTSPKCGQASAQVANDASVNVHADSTCKV
jgi:hypothetical protein